MALLNLHHYTDVILVKKNYENKICKKKFLFVLIVIFMTTVFNTNFINSFDTAFSHFQYDSEDLVIGKITAKHFNLETGWQGLGRVKCESVKDRWASEKIYKNNKIDKTMKFQPYSSQFGLQGKVYGFFSKFFYSKKICSFYRGLNSFFLAFVLTSICWLISYKFGKLMAIVWGTIFVLSPWIVDFARNLYWVEFTWFIPMLLGLMLVSDRVTLPHKENLIYFLTFLFVGVKSACGYEYLSSILLAMIMFPTIELFELCISDEKVKAKELLRQIMIMSVCALSGFCVVLFLHSYFRGDGNVFMGLKHIYQQDVLRRTLGGDPSKFHKVYANSFNATVWEVVKIYFRYWDNAFRHDVIMGINGKFFTLMTTLAFMLGFIRLWVCKHYKEYRVVIMLFLFSMLTAVSWYVLGKSHSYVHRHMNYVLWYFGYVQVCFYIIIDSIWKLMKSNIIGDRDE